VAGERFVLINQLVGLTRSGNGLWQRLAEEGADALHDLESETWSTIFLRVAVG
jgi:hypothetical protein